MKRGVRIARAVFLALVLGIAILSGTAPSRAADEWRPSAFTLENGLKLVVIEDHRAPVVTHMVWYSVGGADDPPGKSGLAHFLEHLMFKGTKRIRPGELSQIVARNGGVDNAFTTQDHTVYHQRVARNRLPIVMELEADRMSNLLLRDEEVRPELKVVAEERRLRIENSPSAVLNEKLLAALFGAHSYAIPTIGRAEEILQLTRQDAFVFYKSHYGPDRAVVVVAGDVEPDAVLALAEKFYGDAKPVRTDQLARSEATPPAPQTITYRDQRVKQPTFYRYALGPHTKNAPDGELEALSVLMRIFGGGVTSRLYRRLVVEERVAASAGASFSSASLGPGYLFFYATPSQTGSLEAVEAEIERVRADMLDGRYADEEIARAKSALAASAIYARDNQVSMARWIGGAVASGYTVDDALDWTDVIRSVTRADLERVARTYLDTDSFVTGRLLPEGGE